MQTQLNFNKTGSTISSKKSLGPASPSSSDQQKLFYRKPSFKYYQRKEKKESDPSNKICFISPEKSDLFKKYNNPSPNQTDLNSSYLTNVSSETSSFQDQRKSFKSNCPRSILNEIKNVRTQDFFRTPKNTKIDANIYASPINSKVITFNRGKTESIVCSSKILPDFDKDFQTLITENAEHQTVKNLSSKNFQDLKKKQSLKKLQSIESQSHQNEGVQYLQMQLKILQESLQQMNIKYNAVEVQKKQLQQSSKIFLSQIKNLQEEVGKMASQKTQTSAQIFKLNVLIAQKDKKINDLEKDLQNLQNQSKILQQRFQEQQMNENYKALYFQVNEKLKYADVKNSILKKYVDEKKYEQRRLQSLQVMNKRLILKNKNLLRSISELQQELQNAQLQNMKKNGAKDAKERPGSKASPSQKSLTKTRTPSFILQKSSRSCKSGEKSLQQLDNVDESDIVSTGSLQFSFEISPQKSFQSSRLNEEGQVPALMNINKCFN